MCIRDRNNPAISVAVIHTSLPVTLTALSSMMIVSRFMAFLFRWCNLQIPRHDKVFEIEMFERGGGRHMKLSILNEYILSAELLK